MTDRIPLVYERSVHLRVVHDWRWGGRQVAHRERRAGDAAGEQVTSSRCTPAFSSSRSSSSSSSSSPYSSSSSCWWSWGQASLEAAD
ncbi:hypothetical protein E2C01_032046 [Portunus trituberculatus]|uniref:Uncharacterized protein n=1 Tax=Portunus trituberculatus TaxID=210409 RepID=A0A5B7EZW3_PORTR|nr:hypothetical protein [Portunus trituberculatus]